MATPYTQNNTITSPKSTASDFLQARIQHYLQPIHDPLHQHIDKRLVKTFVCLFTSILLFRNTKMGLLLSELGGYVAGHAHAPAGTKRISNLLRCKAWKASVFEEFFWANTRRRIEQLQSLGKRPLLLWDDSRLEKPESWFIEGLCSVESSKGKRLTKIKKGLAPCSPYLCAGFPLDRRSAGSPGPDTQCVSDELVDYPWQAQRSRH